MATLCRDCLHFEADDGTSPPGTCPTCSSRRLVAHAELATLSVAHVDCDAFFASVEKRDRPDLANKPVIIGGGRRGVVSTACYVARLYGVRSAMPMFKALAACPDAVVIRPDMRKYAIAGRQVRTLMRKLTPLVQPLSIDEAFLDLSGTEAMHGRTAAQSCGWLAAEVEREVGVTLSIGLSHNKFLAKVASDLDKPRGFFVIGQAETLSFLAPRPVSTIWGVGAAFRDRLAADGIRTIGDLRQLSQKELMSRYGSMGRRLYSAARGEDARAVSPERETKSISAETTLERDIAERAALEERLRPLCDKVADRLKASGLAGRTVVLKIKDNSFQISTRSHTLDRPTANADEIFAMGHDLLSRLADGQTAFRLIGIGLADLTSPPEEDLIDLMDTGRARQKDLDAAVEQIGRRYGNKSVQRGTTRQ